MTCHLISTSNSVLTCFSFDRCSYFTAVSGTSLYESWVYSSFNIVLGLPIIFFGILDRDITADFTLRHPQVNLFFCFSRFSDLLTVFLFSCCRRILREKKIVY
jgi:hypothetical protein